MDINELLKGVECSCGRHHTCGMEHVYIEHDAMKRFSQLCREYENILIVADENTYAAAGKQTTDAISDKKITSVIFDGSHILIPDERAIETVESKISGIDLIIGIGSGVIQDLCKYVSKDKDIPYMICATAPSMDGYASSGAAMILKGMKETVSAGVPKAVVADTAVLKNAPKEMIKAGYGDIIGKFSALNDWKLSHIVNGEYYCEYIYGLTYDMVKKTLSLAEGIATGDEESIGTLMEALVIVGILMSFAGSSRPASGSEHHLSHFFEITGIIDNTDYLPHGTDVAYSTVITAKIREELLKTDFADNLYIEKEDEYKQNMRTLYKSVADECFKLQEKTGSYKNDKMSIYHKKEKEIRAVLSEMPSSAEIEKMLAAVGLELKEFYDIYGTEKIKNAVKYAKDLKDRYTVLWLNYDMNAGEVAL